MCHKPTCCCALCQLCIHCADAHTHIYCPYKAQECQECRNCQRCGNFFFFFNRTNTLEIQLICYAARQYREYPEQYRACPKLFNRATHRKHFGINIIQNVFQTTAHVCNLNNGNNAHQNHKAGKNKVCPCYGFQACRHNEQQTYKCKDNAKQLIVHTCNGRIDAPKCCNLRGNPSEGYKDCHNRGYNTYKFTVIRKMSQNFRYCCKVILAQPFCRNHDKEKRQNRQQTINQNCHTIQIRIPQMPYQNTAAHSAGKLCADNYINWKTSVCYRPVILGYCGALTDNISRNERCQNNQYCC